MSDDASALDDLVLQLSKQIAESNWVAAELARKQAAGEPLVSIFDLAAAAAAPSPASLAAPPSTATAAPASTK